VCSRAYNKDSPQLQKLSMAIREMYLHRWIVDNLPVAQSGTTDSGEKVYRLGFPVGCVANSADERVACSQATSESACEPYRS
jgi:hypothetical protein